MEDHPPIGFVQTLLGGDRVGNQADRQILLERHSGGQIGAGDRAAGTSVTRWMPCSDLDRRGTSLRGLYRP
ncbi:hypothetical protein [Nocardia sp. NPDC005825]|uniref:hypothetical protein n=1 Tax=unclassified Nocardia TaxID=2637762 RepID=UPI0033CB8086